MGGGGARRGDDGNMRVDEARGDPGAKRTYVQTRLGAAEGHKRHFMWLISYNKKNKLIKKLIREYLIKQHSK